MRSFELDLSKYEGVKGTFKLKVPTYRERLKMIKECNFQMNDKGEINIGLDSIDSIIRLVDVTHKYFEVVKLEKDKVKVSSFEEAEQYSEFDGIITEAASAVLNAGALGK